MLDLALSDGEYLLVILIALYLVEGVIRVPTGATIFTVNPLTPHCRAAAGRFFVAEGGGWEILCPLPAAYGLICQQWPLSLSPSGVYAYAAQATDDGRRPPHEEFYLGWDEITSVVASDRDVLVNSRQLVRVCSGGFAIQLRETLLKLRSSSDEQRAIVIENVLREALDVSEVRRRILHFQRASRSLILPSLGMWLLLLVVLPLLIWSPNNSPETAIGMWMGVAGFGFCWVAQIVGYIAALRRLRRLVPQARLPNRTWMLCISPPTALWARDRLARDLLSEFHPLAVAAAVCSPAEFRRLACHTLRDLLYPQLPACPSAEGPAQQTEDWFRGQLLAAAKQTMIDAGASIDELLAPPIPDGDDVRSYCPRCQSQYVLERGTCQACGGIELHLLTS